jgi:hypothetical protein
MGLFGLSIGGNLLKSVVFLHQILHQTLHFDAFWCNAPNNNPLKPLTLLGLRGPYPSLQISCSTVELQRCLDQVSKLYCYWFQTSVSIWKRVQPERTSVQEARPILGLPLSESLTRRRHRSGTTHSHTYHPQGQNGFWYTRLPHPGDTGGSVLCRAQPR